MRFVGDPLTPLTATSDTACMAAGDPGIPRAFLWRGRVVEVTAVLRSWGETGPCTHGSGEMYVRKHWFEVATAADGTLRIYFERRPRRGKRSPSRWWLFAALEPPSSP